MDNIENIKKLITYGNTLLQLSSDFNKLSEGIGSHCRGMYIPLSKNTSGVRWQYNNWCVGVLQLHMQGTFQITYTISDIRWAHSVHVFEHFLTDGHTWKQIDTILMKQQAILKISNAF